MRLRRFTDLLKVLNVLAITVFIMMFSKYSQAFNDNTNTNVCKPVVNLSTCDSKCKKTCPVKPRVIYKTRLKEIEKVVEKRVNVPVVKKKYFKNHASILAGYGALGNIQESNNGTSNVYRTEQGLVLGLQYMRDIKQREDYSIHLGIQGQTNKTFSIMGGVGF